MVNEQLLNNLQKLGINQEEVENLDHTSLALINALLLTISQKDEELLNYQTQITGFKQQLARKKPRRLSISSNSSEEGNDLSPRVALISERPTPPRTPRTPLRSTSPAILELEVIKEMVGQQEIDWEINASQLITEAQTSEKSFQTKIRALNKQLYQKEKDLGRLETNQQIQEAEISRLSELNSKTNQNLAELKKEFKQQVITIQRLSKELEETNNDFLLVSENLKDTNFELQEVRDQKIELEQILLRERAERFHLQTSYQQTQQTLLIQLEEIEQSKQLFESKSQALQDLVQQQAAQYDQEQQQRAEEFQIQLDNLRRFQNQSSSLRKSAKNRHRRTNMFGSGSHFDYDSESYDVEVKEEQIVFTSPKKSRPKSENLFWELQKKGFSENGGQINSNNDFTNSPVSQEENVLDASFTKENNKRNSTSSLISNPEGVTLPLSQVEDILSDIVDLSTESTDAGYQLAEEHQALEKAYKELLDQQPALERTIQQLNQELLAFKEVKQKDWKNELDQAKYELQESKANQRILCQHTSELETKLANLVNDKHKKSKAKSTDKQLTKPNYLKEIRSLLAEIHQPINELTKELKTENQILIQPK